MSNEKRLPEVTHQFRTTEWLVRPENLPEAGFQSYQKLKNDASKHKAAFIAGEVRNPELSYPELKFVDEIDLGISNLVNAMDQVRQVEPNEEITNIVITSLEFRQAEMEYVKLLAELNDAVSNNLAIEVVRPLAENARSLGHELYGTPDEKLVNSSLGEVWNQLDQKHLSESAQQLYGELEGMLPRPDTYEKLPDFNHPSLAWAGEIILNENTDIEALLREWWDDKVAEHGEGFVAHAIDTAEAFSLALGYMDPEEASGVGVRLDPDATALSWESPEMSIVVGEKRGPIKSAEELFKKFLHEGVGHGGRAIKGLRTGVPVLGTGLFTNTQPRADYLTYEEGLCTTIEEAVSSEEPKWDTAKLWHYINISLAEAGKDFREVFEAAWRYRLLMSVGDGEDVTYDVVEKHQSAAYTAAVRIFRGTPTTLKDKYPDIPPLTYNKDLAYLNGRILAMDHIKELYDNQDEQSLIGLFDAKYDPTIPEQAAIVAKYVGPAGKSVSNDEGR